MSDLAGELGGFLSGAMWQTHDANMYGSEDDADRMHDEPVFAPYRDVPRSLPLHRVQHRLYYVQAQRDLEQDERRRRVTEDWLSSKPELDLDAIARGDE